MPLWKLTEKKETVGIACSYTNLPEGITSFPVNVWNYQIQSMLLCFNTDREIKLNEIHFQTLIIWFFFVHFIDNRSDSDQWSESKRQLHLWNTRSNQCLWLIHYKLKECCLSTCLWWHVQYNCKPLHGSSPNLLRQMTFLLLLLVCANFFHSQLKPAFLLLDSLLMFCNSCYDMY